MSVSNINKIGSESSDIIDQPVKKKIIKGLTRSDLKAIEASVNILQNEPTGGDLVFMHSVMCKVGLPRSSVDGLEFERINGNAGINIRAGKLWDGKKFVQQPLPFGSIPRLVLAYLNTLALRQKSPVIDVGSSARDFLKKLGKDSSGGVNGSLTSLRKQMAALAACNITIGLTTDDSAITYDGKPIQKFEAFLLDQEEKTPLWPRHITFSHEYYETLKKHAVPLDIRAVKALSSSALAVDLYVMLADRLHRVYGRPVTLYWRNLLDQFGHEYAGKHGEKNFKKAFLVAFKKVELVYPGANVKVVTGGILMSHSNPPVNYKATPCYDLT